MKKIICASLSVLTAFFLTGCTGIKSRNKFYSPEKIKSDASVFISIDCSNILENIDDLDKGLGKYIPDYGLVIPDGEYPIKNGDSVYDILVRVARQNKIQLESKGLFSGREIEGINYIYNSSCGAESRWVYKVNGEIQQSVCSEYKVKNGDVIQWIFLCGG